MSLPDKAILAKAADIARGLAIDAVHASNSAGIGVGQHILTSVL